MLPVLLALAIGRAPVAPSPAPQLTVRPPWTIHVAAGRYQIGSRAVRVARDTDVAVAPAEVVRVRAERHDTLPLFDAKAAPWNAGDRLKALVTFETTAADLLLPESVRVHAADGRALKEGTDYALERRWGTFGRLAGGSLGATEAVTVDYDYAPNRLDTLSVDRRGSVAIVRGVAHVATPQVPAPLPGFVRLANVWVPGRTAALDERCLYRVVEPRYPAPKRATPPAKTLLRNTWRKLTSGQAVHVLAWGDSVTAGGQTSDAAHRYEDRFVAELAKAFPKARVRLTVAAWGGRNSDSFLNDPPGAPHNFDEQVIAPHPDLVVMEFVNDAYLTPAQVEQKYAALLERFRAAGIEWAILTPHFVRPDWMGAQDARVEQDPRPYTAALRAFAAQHHVALADASLRWGHLVREGIPYTTLLSNSINHPNDQGHELFVRALMELFGR